jgi:hypothetical protein
MATHSSRNLTAMTHYRNSIRAILLLFGLAAIGQPAFSQDTGLINSWSLIDMPRGETGSGKTYGIHWDVQRVDATGGHIRGKLFLKNNPACFAWADFKWDIFPDISRVNQDDRFQITLSIDAKKGGDCSIPLDPYMKASVMSGVVWPEEIGGTISLAGKDLVHYASRDDIHKRVGNSGLVNKVEQIGLVFTDRTSIGAERDARDGGFFLNLSWRGYTYYVFYKYAPYDLGGFSPAIGGTWSGTWKNHTFGTQGNCSFTITETGGGGISATGNSGFGTWAGQRDGQAAFLHSSDSNSYEYWTVVDIEDAQTITLHYLGYGHGGSRKGEAWTGVVHLKR